MPSICYGFSNAQGITCLYRVSFDDRSECECLAWNVAHGIDRTGSVDVPSCELRKGFDWCGCNGCSDGRECTVHKQTFVLPKTWKSRFIHTPCQNKMLMT